MLRSLTDLERYTVSASDGDVGSVGDLLFDDERWIVRYLVVETSGFSDEREVLILPISFRHAEWQSRRFHLALTKEKVENSPSIETDKPVSRQHERDFYRYYGYPSYWGYSGLWGVGAYPELLAGGAWNDLSADHADEAGDVHLRSANEVGGYHVDGSDESVGHVADFIVDDETWQIRFLVIDTAKWWFGKKVLMAPRWARDISWVERSLTVGISREAIRNSPEWDPTAPINREYEVRLYDYYGRPVDVDSDDRPPQVPPPRHSGSDAG